MTELLPPGFVFHQSNLQAFQNCRFSFLLRYVRKLPWPAPLSARTDDFEKDLAAGSTLHGLIHQFFLGIDPELLVSCAANYPDARVSAWFASFLASPYAKQSPNQLTEHSTQITLNDSLLLAKFDLITLEEDMIKICDWKTSRVLPKRQFLEERIQTKVYSLVASRMSQSVRLITMHYWEAAFPEHPVILEISDTQLQRYELEIADLISRIRSLPEAEFKRTEDPRRCSYCEYQSYCLRNGSPADEESFQDWFEIGLSEIQGQEN